jgi:hypothetical protein
VPEKSLEKEAATQSIRKELNVAEVRVSSDNALVCIEDIPSGKTSLTCLYCGGGLTG